MSSDDNYVAVLLEEIRGQNKAVLEAVGQISDTVRTLASQESLDAVDTKVTTIQQALTETNVDIAQLDTRLTVLERAV